jgi:hypothetical protein
MGRSSFSFTTIYYTRRNKGLTRGFKVVFFFVWKKTIFYDLPRLANITCEEWISTAVLKSCGMSTMNHIALENSDFALKQFTAAAWVLKTSSEYRESVDSLQL